MALTYNTEVDFQVNVKIKLPNGWRDYPADAVEADDRSVIEMADDETFKPQLEISIVGETDPAFTEVYTIDWAAAKVEDVDGELQTVIDEEDQLFFSPDGFENMQNFVDAYTRHLADVRYDRLVEEPAE